MDPPMTDIIAIAIILASFVLAEVYVIACERLKGSRT